MDLVGMHNKLNELLFAEMVAGRRFVLVVDEAQNLDDSVLETVRLLSNFETSYAKMLQIVLAGQPQLSSKLSQPKLAQLKQRLAVQAKLDPLSASETANYIDHRLMVAGHTGAPLFTPDALAVIARLSGGTPRTINHLCYGAMSTAHELGHETIHADVVDAVAMKLGFSSAPAIAPHPEKAIAREPAVAGVAARAATASAAAGSQPAPAPAPPKPTAAQPNPSAPSSTPSMAPAAAENKGPTAAPESGVGLTYEEPKRFRLPRWAFRAMVLAGILLLAGIFLTAFVLRFTESGHSGATFFRNGAGEYPCAAPVAAEAALRPIRQWRTCIGLLQRRSTRKRLGADHHRCGKARPNPARFEYSLRRPLRQRYAQADHDPEPGIKRPRSPRTWTIDPIAFARRIV